MNKSVKIFFYISGICTVILLSVFGIPKRIDYDYRFTELPTIQQLTQFYQIDSKENDLYRVAITFQSYIQNSSVSLIDFIIIASIEFIKVLFFDKPLYLDFQGDNQVFDEEKVPSYVQGKKRKHLLDEKEIPIIKLILVILLIVKDMIILPLSLIAYDWQSVNGLVQFGQIIIHTFLSPQVLLSIQHLAYSRFEILQDIAEDTENEQIIEKIVISLMNCIRVYICTCLLVSFPLLICGCIFGTLISIVFGLATLGLFLPFLILFYIKNKRGFSLRAFVPYNLIIFVGVGLIIGVSYILQVGVFIADGNSIKQIFQYYFGPNTYSLWYFAFNNNISWKSNLDYFVRVIAVL